MILSNVPCSFIKAFSTRQNQGDFKLSDGLLNIGIPFFFFTYTCRYKCINQNRHPTTKYIEIYNNGSAFDIYRIIDMA